MRASQACPHVSLYLELSGNNIAYYSMNHRPPSSIGTEQGSHDAALTAINGRQGAASSAGLSMPLPQVQPQPQLGQQHHRQGLMHDHNATSGGGRTVEVHPFASQVHHTPCMAFQDPRYALPGGTSSSNNPHLGLTAHLLSGEYILSAALVFCNVIYKVSIDTTPHTHTNKQFMGLDFHTKRNIVSSFRCCSMVTLFLIRFCMRSPLIFIDCYGFCQVHPCNNNLRPQQLRHQRLLLQHREPPLR